MAVSNVKAVFGHNVQRVWDIVTSLENYQWRSDLSKIEVIGEKQFVEYDKNGYATTFTITASEPCGRWEFDMEDVTAKRMIMKPFVKAFLKKQQALYISDLKKELEVPKATE